MGKYDKIDLDSSPIIPPDNSILKEIKATYDSKQIPIPQIEYDDEGTLTNMDLKKVLEKSVEVKSYEGNAVGTAIRVPNGDYILIAAAVDHIIRAIADTERNDALWAYIKDLKQSIDDINSALIKLNVGMTALAGIASGGGSPATCTQVGGAAASGVLAGELTAITTDITNLTTFIANNSIIRVGNKN